MSEDSMQRTVTVPEEVLWQKLPDGESVFLNLQSEEYYGLNQSGTAMWEALASSATIGEAHGKLMEVFDTDPESLGRDLLAVIDRLVERGLIAIGDA